jgi:hypothetical protein
MKKSLIATLVAVPLLSLSSMAFASEPMLLSSAQMDGVTAGNSGFVFVYKRATVGQVNTSPVNTFQLSVLNLGSGSGGNNGVSIDSGNHSYIHQ